MRRFVRHFRKLFVHELEDRTTPAWLVSLAGNAVSFTGDAANDNLTLSVVGGNLSHNVPLSGNLASAIDLDGVTAGVQSLAMTAVTGLTVTGNGGNDSLNVTDVATSATISVESFQWQASAASPDADATLTDTNFTVNDVLPASYMYSLSGVTTIGGFTGGSGNNAISAANWAGGNITINGLAGDL